MTSLHRVVVQWAGPQVTGLAVNVLHYSASDNSVPPVAAIRDAYNMVFNSLPGLTTIQVPGSGDTIDDTTGELVGAWTAATPAVITGTGSSTAAAGVGACIGWQTGGIVPGTKGPRRLRGRTYVVPLSTDAYDPQGTLTTTALTRLGQMADALQAAGPLAVWHRPLTPGSATGNSYGVISHRVRDKVAYLSSRRD